MQTILLPGGTTPTSRIGLGCGRLAGGPAFRDSAAVVEAALAAGVRHFDVAPLYGMGTAETVLGRVLAGVDGVTIITKAGIAPPKGGSSVHLVRETLKRLLRGVPQIKARLAAAASEVLPPARGLFSPDQVQASFGASLKALRRDRVDALLLHEAPVETPPGLEVLLSAMRAEGLIGAFGAGTGKGVLDLPAIGQIAQHAWAPIQSPGDGRLSIRHGLFHLWLARLPAALPADASDRRALSDDVGFDLDDVDALPSLLLTLALSADPDGMVLISSTDATRITRVLRQVDWPAIRAGRAPFLAARDRILRSLNGAAADV